MTDGTRCPATAAAQEEAVDKLAGWVIRRQLVAALGWLASICGLCVLARYRFAVPASNVRGPGTPGFQAPAASTCDTNYEFSYLTADALPPAGTVCAQDTTPCPTQ